MSYQIQENTTVHTQSNVSTRSLLKNTFTWMFLGLLITAAVAGICISNPTIMNYILRNPMVLMVAFIAELGLVFYFSYRIMSLSTQAAIGIFFLYAALNGFTLSVLLYMYTGTSVLHVFIISALLFGGMALYGHITKKDLSSLGSMLIMGLWGIIIASIVNLFFRSSGLATLISFVAVIIFMGLTAYDVQKIKRIASQVENGSSVNYVRISILGALQLYLDFINIFIYLLMLLGRRK